MKRHIIIGFIILSIFSLSLFATTEVLQKHDLHNISCSVHKHQHIHNTVQHTHIHSHKINLVDFYITENLLIKLSSNKQKDNFDYTQQYSHSIPNNLFRPPTI